MNRNNVLDLHGINPLMEVVVNQDLTVYVIKSESGEYDVFSMYQGEYVPIVGNMSKVDGSSYLLTLETHLVALELRGRFTDVMDVLDGIFLPGVTIGAISHTTGKVLYHTYDMESEALTETVIHKSNCITEVVTDVITFTGKDIIIMTSDNTYKCDLRTVDVDI